MIVYLGRSDRQLREQDPEEWVRRWTNPEYRRRQEAEELKELRAKAIAHERATYVPHHRRPSLIDTRAGKRQRGVVFGYATRWWIKSTNDGGSIYVPGCFEKYLSDSKAEVHALIGHDWNRVIGRRSAGELYLAEDSQGLYFELKIPATGWGPHARALFDIDFTMEMSIHSPDAKKRTPYGDGSGGFRLEEAGLTEISILPPPQTAAVKGARCWIERGAGALSLYPVVAAAAATPTLRTRPEPTADEWGSTPEERRQNWIRSLERTCKNLGVQLWDPSRPKVPRPGLRLEPPPAW